MRRPRPAVAAIWARAALGLLLIGALPATAAEIAIEESAGLDRAYPLRGQPIRIAVTGDDGAPLAGVVVEAVYRPNSQTVHTALLDPTAADGTAVWIPDDAGIVTLVAHQGSAQGPALAALNVAVRFGGFPASGLVVMIIAGLVLFGGAAFGFARLLGPDGGRLPPGELPST